MNRSASFARRTLSWSWAPLTRRCRTACTSGDGLADALAAHRRLTGFGLETVISYFSQPEEDGSRVYDELQAALNAIAAERPTPYLAVKTSLLDFNSELVEGVVKAADRLGVSIDFDSLGPEHAAVTLDLASRAADSANVGVTLPGRWVRSVADAKVAATWARRVRVVKGQWPDPNHPVDVREGFLAVVDALAGRARVVALATHDAPLAAEALRRLAAAGTPAELWLLFGLELSRPLAVARQFAVPVRVYVPYGGWFLPRPASLLRNPGILWWALQAAAYGREKPWRDLRRAVVTPRTRNRQRSRR